jgi:hypothetical protein
MPCVSPMIHPKRSLQCVEKMRAANVSSTNVEANSVLNPAASELGKQSETKTIFTPIQASAQQQLGESQKNDTTFGADHSP